MPKCKMLVNANFDQLRVAIIGEKGLLEQVDFESMNNTNNLGNIYKATITAIEPSLQAAFVDYGGNRHGFLPFNEIHHRYFANSDRRQATSDRLKVGQHVIIQVAREEIGLKGAYMTTYLSLPGQYLVMMPLTSKVGISRKIENQDDRRSVRDLLEQISVPDGMGYIIRTAGLGKNREQLQRDLNLLTTTWGELESRAERTSSPALLYQEDDVVTRTIRDYFSEDVGEVLVDDETVFETVSAYFRKVMPSYAHMVKLYRHKTPLFTRFRLDDQIDHIFASKIILPSGGSIVIEQTEALVVIDVNSGKTSEGNLEATALKSNLEAAEEIARQLRLRDLGGLIVIDFIDLKEKRHNQDVEQRLKDSLKDDKARITVTGLSRFGLLEMSRQRISSSKDNRHYVDCPACAGGGRVKSLEMQSLDLLRKATQVLSSKPVRELKISCSEELGLHLLNERREDLGSLEKKYTAAVRILIKPNYFGPPIFDIIKRPQQEENKEMVMPPPLSLSTMAASMSDTAINEQKDYREEKLEALEKMGFEELRGLDIPTPQSLSPFERFNFSVRVSLMKRHGLYESRFEEFREAMRESVLKGNRRFKDEDAAEDGQDHDDEEGFEDDGFAREVADVTPVGFDLADFVAPEDVPPDVDLIAAAAETAAQAGARPRNNDRGGRPGGRFDRNGRGGDRFRDRNNPRGNDRFASRSEFREDRGDRPDERGDRNPRPERMEGGERPNRFERPEGGDRNGRMERPEGGNRFERPEGERLRTERNDGGGRNRFERRDDRGENGERPPRPAGEDRGRNGGNGQRFERPRFQENNRPADVETRGAVETDAPFERSGEATGERSDRKDGRGRRGRGRRRGGRPRRPDENRE